MGLFRWQLGYLHREHRRGSLKSTRAFRSLKAFAITGFISLRTASPISLFICDTIRVACSTPSVVLPKLAVIASACAHQYCLSLLIEFKSAKGIISHNIIHISLNPIRTLNLLHSYVPNPCNYTVSCCCSCYKDPLLCKSRNTSRKIDAAPLAAVSTVL